MTAVVDAGRRFLGVGWKFPLQVTPEGRIARARHEQRIEEAIYLILGTSPGERAMLPEFGCGIHDMVFSPDDSVSVSIMLQQVRDALVSWEPRIDVIEVEAGPADREPGKLLIRITYRVRSNNAIANLVYPFYIREGM